MISTRLHGLADYTVAALFGRLALASRLPLPVRATFGAAGAYHAGYSLLTDYEAGLRPDLSMRQHLALDVAGAAALLGAGVFMRRQPVGARLLLLGAGLAECALIARSTATPGSGPQSQAGLAGRMLGLDDVPVSEIAEAPLDIPKPVTPDIFVVDSTMRGPLGLTLPVRMTVIRLRSGDLLLHSPTRLTPALREALEALGPVRHLVAPNSVHWTFLRQWQNAFPQALTWGAPGLRSRAQVRSSGVRIDRDLNEKTPPGWTGIDIVLVRGGLGFREVALFHTASRTLVLTDLVLNLQSGQVPASLRPLAKRLSVIDAEGKPPVYLRAVIALRRRSAAKAAARLLALDPERVVFAHGPWFRNGGKARLAHALRWLVPTTR